jgi:hypothetical protein
MGNRPASQLYAEASNQEAIKKITEQKTGQQMNRRVLAGQTRWACRRSRKLPFSSSPCSARLDGAERWQAYNKDFENAAADSTDLTPCRCSQ